MSKRRETYHWSPQSIRALRQYMQMTQQQMSEELGTRQQTISEWETGMYRPRGGMNRLLTLVAEQAGFDYRSVGQEPDDEASGEDENGNGNGNENENENE